MEQNAEACTDDDNNNQVYSKPLPSKELEQFQADLNSLHCIIDYIPVRKFRDYKEFLLHFRTKLYTIVRLLQSLK